MSEQPNRGAEPASAASLLLTLLGEFVLPDRQPVWTSTLTEALAVLGVQDKAARQALARTGERGLLERDKQGRRVRWGLTPAAIELLEEGTAHIYRFGTTPKAWDGQWLLVLCSLPAARAELRHRLRVRLGWAGLAPFGPGAWISPWVDRQPEAVEVLRQFDLHGQARSFTGRLGVLGDVSTTVAQAWELEGLEGRYRQFLADFGEQTAPEAPTSGASPGAHEPGRSGPQGGEGPDATEFAALCWLVHRWRRFPTIDPELPRELWPLRWPAEAAVTLFHRQHARWTPAAQRWWHTRTPA